MFETGAMGRCGHLRVAPESVGYHPRGGQQREHPVDEGGQEVLQDRQHGGFELVLELVQELDELHQVLGLREGGGRGRNPKNMAGKSRSCTETLKTMLGTRIG